MGTLIIGVLLLAALFWAFKRTRQSMKHNGCPGCSGNCSDSGKSCHH